MSSPLVYIEQREALAKQLAHMEQAFERRSAGEDITQESIDGVKAEIAAMDAEIERMRSGNA